MEELTADVCDVSGHVFVESIKQRVKALEIDHAQEGAVVCVRFRSGEIRLIDGGSSDDARFILRAENQARLYSLQQIVHAWADRTDTGARIVWDRVNAGAFPPNFSLVTVLQTTRISPNFCRVRVCGDNLHSYMKDGLHFTLILPPHGRAAIWPVIGASGRTVWPDGADKPHRAVYTIRKVDSHGMWFEFDVYLHDGGRVTDWSEKVQPQDVLGLTGPTTREMRSSGWMAFFGDETALPAIARALEVLPKNVRGYACIELGNPDDRQDLNAPEGICIEWLTRGRSISLLERLRQMAIPPADRMVWFAADSAQAAAARTYLKSEIACDRKEMNVVGYWSSPKPTS